MRWNRGIVNGMQHFWRTGENLGNWGKTGRVILSISSIPPQGTGIAGMVVIALDGLQTFIQECRRGSSPKFDRVLLNLKKN